MKKILFIFCFLPFFAQGQMSAAKKLLLTQGTATTVFTLSTTSTSTTWSPSNVSKTGATLHWAVTGAVTTSADVNDPTFDFSTAGTKNIVVTSTDGAEGLTLLDIYSLNITLIDITYCTYLLFLDVHDNQLTVLSILTSQTLINLFVNSNQLTKTIVDAILDKFIDVKFNGGEFDCSSQSPAITPDAGKIAALQALGWTVSY